MVEAAFLPVGSGSFQALVCINPPEKECRKLERQIPRSIIKILRPWEKLLIKEAVGDLDHSLVARSLKLISLKYSY